MTTTIDPPLVPKPPKKSKKLKQAKKQSLKAKKQHHLDPAERARLEKAIAVPRARNMLGAAIAVVFLLWSFQGAGFNFQKLGEGSVNMVNFVGRLFPPDFSKLGLIVELLIETIQMAIVSTVLGAILSLFIAMAAASNLALKYIYYPARWIMNVIRAIPTSYSHSCSCQQLASAHSRVFSR